MESYIPLVKAIIISTMFTWGTSSVTITDHYILDERNFSDQFTGEECKEFRIYDLKMNVIHIVNDDEKSRITFQADSLDKIEIKIKGIRKTGVPQVLKTSVIKEDLGEYKCKREIKEMEYAYFIDGHHVDKYTDNTYFAKLLWLDNVLDTKIKRQFAGFDRQEYAPYRYLVYEVYEYLDLTTKDQLVRVIEPSEVDTTFIHYLLTLPLKTEK